MHHVFGKAGRATTPTDPAGLSMLETTIALVDDKSKWRTRHSPPLVRRLAGVGQGPAGLVLARRADDHRQRTDLRLERTERGPRAGPRRRRQTAGPDQRLDDADQDAHRHALDRHQDAGRHQSGGDDLDVLAELAEKISTQLRTMPETVSAFPEKTLGGNYVDFRIDRGEAARYGMNVRDVQDVILTAWAA